MMKHWNSSVVEALVAPCGYEEALSACPIRPSRWDQTVAKAEGNRRHPAVRHKRGGVDAAQRYCHRSVEAEPLVGPKIIARSTCRPRFDRPLRRDVVRDNFVRGRNYPRPATPASAHCPMLARRSLGEGGSIFGSMRSSFCCGP